MEMKAQQHTVNFFDLRDINCTVTQLGNKHVAVQINQMIAMKR
jgi:hypothetical protein